MTTFPNSPRLLKGGLVLVNPESQTPERVIALQYNPDTLTRTLAPQSVPDSADRSSALRLKGPAVAIVAPAALLVLPILDTTAAIVRRKLTGRGLAVSDRGHLHHMMLRRGSKTLRRPMAWISVMSTAARRNDTCSRS